jgi:hypothetical protein
MNEFVLSDMQRRVMNLVQIGVVKEKKDNQSLVDFGLSSQWCRLLVPNENSFFIPNNGDMVLVVFPYGDMTDGFVCGSIAATGSDENTLISKDKLIIQAKKLEIRTESDELLSLLCEALQIIATSTTMVQGAPMMSAENSTQLPKIITRLRSMCL